MCDNVLLFGRQEDKQRIERSGRINKAKMKK